MKHGSITTFQYKIVSQVSGQQLVKAVQSDQKLNSGLERLWHSYFGTHMVFCLSIILKKIKPLTATITWYYHQDNVPYRKFMKTMVKLNKLSVELLPHPAYSPDLAPSDY